MLIDTYNYTAPPPIANYTIEYIQLPNEFIQHLIAYILGFGIPGILFIIAFVLIGNQKRKIKRLIEEHKQKLNEQQLIETLKPDDNEVMKPVSALVEDIDAQPLRFELATIDQDASVYMPCITALSPSSDLDNTSTPTSKRRMITQTQKRDSNLGLTPQSELGPGSYSTAKSTLKYSKYTGMAPFLQMSRKKSVFEEEAQKRSYLPSVGQYDSTTQPLYIRGTNPNTSQFASKTERFVFRPKNVPGPGEYEASSQFDPKAPLMPSIKPAKITPQQITEPSIPYQNQPKLSNELTQNQRNRWVLETAGYEQLTNPSCQDYDPYYVPELPKDVQVVVPVGGGGSSLARTMKPSPWAKAPNRFDIDPKAKTVRASVGLYQLGNTQYDQLRYQKQSNCFASGQTRFDGVATTTGPRIGPGTYQSDVQGTIKQQNERLRQQTELKEEMQRRLGEADEIVQQLHPLSGSGVQKVNGGAERSSFSPLDLAQMKNPAVGQYNIAEFDQIKPPDVNQLSVDAQMKIALLSTFSVEKWHQQGASIPSKVQSDEVIEEKILPEKPKKRGQLEMQTDRDIGKSLYPQINDEEVAAVGQYNLERSFKKLTGQKKLNQLTTAPFCKGNDQRFMDVIVNENKQKEHQVMVAEQQKYEIDQEKRSVGGVGTQLDYTKAKTASYINNVVFGSTVEREAGSGNGLLGGKDPTFPGPSDYKVKGKDGKQITINYKERIMAGQPSPDVLPEVLRQDIGPGAERALNIIAERRQADTKVGPGLYGGDTVRKVEGLKRSFNIRAQDKKL